MPTVTSIKPQKNGKRLNIYLDGKFSFGIDLENFVKAELKVDQELPEEKIEEIIKKAQFQKTLDKLLRFTTLRPRSEKEISLWLRRKKVHESIREELFNRLKRLELVDDAKFALWWVGQRQAFRPKSLRILRQELGIKGIDKDIINEVLGSVKVDEGKIARELLAKKAYKWKSLPARNARQKMSQYLAGKGFGWELIGDVVDAFLN
ncbi:MAG: RecX family transcriptional regulator [bacterium]